MLMRVDVRCWQRHSCHNVTDQSSASTRHIPPRYQSEQIGGGESDLSIADHWLASVAAHASSFKVGVPLSDVSDSNTTDFSKLHIRLYCDLMNPNELSKRTGWSSSKARNAPIFLFKLNHIYMDFSFSKGRMRVTDLTLQSSRHSARRQVLEDFSVSN